MKLSIVIPLYNENTTISEIIERVRVTSFGLSIIAVGRKPDRKPPQSEGI